ncbi:protein THEM6-like [Diprion similis]|uniref:protein THEM6-like n=1 Tax=Diprion similis TaxID=362088 RepID=UPI001EF94AF7|nr:protein THEM6-like [Diprion similis]XP_046743225.1 protein THEM6-like [Diprion similis]
MVCLFYNILAIVAAMYSLFDVNYFVRLLFTTLWRKIIPRKKKRFSEDIRTYGFCTTNDVDFFMTHMNNARFLRELDFSRIDFYHRTGLYEGVVSRKATVLQGATTVRYRKPLPIFAFYQVTTRLVYCDDKAIYLEHKFITLSDNFVRAIAISKQNITGLEVTVSELISIVDPESVQLEAPEDLKHWLEYINASSQKLKKSD